MQLSYEAMTNEARRAVERARRQATAQHAERATPEHLLLAILAETGSLACQALTALGTPPPTIASKLSGDLPSAEGGADPAPLAYDSELVIHFATKDAYQLGHRQIDALHLLLGIFYLGRGHAHDALKDARVQIVALRQYILERPNLTSKLSVSRDEQLRHILRPSPIFLGLLGVVFASGGALCLGMPDQYATALTLLFVVSGWMTSVCIHEFGHAVAAFAGGDHPVRDKGYLTLDPRRYTHPLLSIIMPLVFMLLGGIGLPGGAVYIQSEKLRSGGWRSFVSAAGPLGTLACILVTVTPFLLPWHRWETATNANFWPALAYLAFVQVTALVLTLLPIPGLDGFGIIAPGLPEGWQQAALRLGFLPLMLVYLVLWQDSPIGDNFWYRVYDLTDAFRIPTWLLVDAMDRLPF
jgi:Zn-dependent protease